ncbi:MAG: hypothetical protein QOJ98_1119 [Acidobacteriota bacterium]|nr:hypothetical protein [Acidobacteriota bacterium]
MAAAVLWRVEAVTAVTALQTLGDCDASKGAKCLFRTAATRASEYLVQ